MTAAFFIFMWVKNEVSYDSYHPDAEHIYRLKTYMNERSVWEMSPFPLGEAAKQELPEVELGPLELPRLETVQKDAPAIAQINLNCPVVRGRRGDALVADLMPVIAPIVALTGRIHRARIVILIEFVLIGGQAVFVDEPPPQISAAFFAGLEIAGAR